MEVEVALRMRDIAGLRNRVSSREVISRDEMAERYYPRPEDYQAVSSWLTSQGFTLGHPDRSRLAIFARGTVARMAAAFHVAFTRVSHEGSEYTAAVDAPSLPSAIASVVLAVNGLQPYLGRVHSLLPKPASLTSTSPPYVPSQILKAYGASGLNLNGAGQTIAIAGASFPATSDLTMFWSACGIGQSLGNIAFVTVDAASTDASEVQEATLDVEWASSLAPAASIRVYAGSSPGQSDTIYQQILDDLPSCPGLHQVSISFGGPESDYTAAHVLTQEQYLLSLTAEGVTVFSSSGDGGSNPTAGTNGGFVYSSTAPTQVLTPAADSYVCAVGGTSLTLGSSGTVSSETAWSGSGGGISTFFTRPSWQTGPGVPAGSMRAVPDVASAANPNTGALIVLNGVQQSIGGTSWSSPTWAAFCALMNQARASENEPPIGLISPVVYSLLGTNAFRDITSGSNGAYSAGPGYDLCTGVGVPNLANLLPALEAAPIFSSPTSGTKEVNPGQSVTLTATASGTGTLAYQWQSQAPGSTAWTNLVDGNGIAGSETPTLTILAAVASSGVAYHCVVSDPTASNVSPMTIVLVAVPLNITTLFGSPSAQTPVTGPLTAARLAYTYDLALDTANNLYLADYGWSILSKVSGGNVTTLAGTKGDPGTADGPASSALFNGPYGVVVDASGNLYDTDSAANIIRKITPSGVVTTLAGTPGVTGSTDGTGAAASFNQPRGLAIDSAGNLYVCDFNNCTIRKVTPTGTVTTLAGSAGVKGYADGTGSAALFDLPRGIAIDHAGNLYVGDTYNNAIRKLTPAGVVTTLAGGTQGATDGIGGQAQFYYPSNLMVDPSGNLFVADTNNALIREVTPAGVVTTVAGSGTAGTNDGLGSAAQFNMPSSIVEDSTGMFYIADSSNFTIRLAQLLPAPMITSEPQSQTATAGGSATFAVTASGTSGAVYQWYFNGLPITGATGANYTIGKVAASNSGAYTVTVSTVGGSVTSYAALLAVQAAGAPTISSAPQSQTIASGSTVVFAVTATSATSLSYQWYWNGAPVAGATNASLLLPAATAADSGTYTCFVTNSAGSAISAAATLTVTNTSNPGRIQNLSILASIDASGMTMGFVSGGAGTNGSEELLTRASGPALAAFALTNFLSDPTLTIVSQVSGVGTVVQNAGWGTPPGNAAAVEAAANSVGAFAWTNTSSLDAAIVQAFSANGSGYSVEVVGKTGDSGTTLAEVWDDTPATAYTLATPRLINLSCRQLVPTQGSLTAGFIIGGNTAKTVLIRAMGPTLGAFGLAPVMPDPELKVYVLGASSPFVTNIGWGGNSVISEVNSSVYAFAPSSATSADSEIVVTLPPGGYSAQATSVSGTSGLVQVEIFEVP